MSFLLFLPLIPRYREDAGLATSGGRFKQALVGSQRAGTEIDMYITRGLWAVKTYGCTQYG